ncbi:MAG: flagellar basal body P-ring formation chaperone FlgA [Candidatus Zixiibacteriota bacterium]
MKIHKIILPLVISALFAIEARSEDNTSRLTQSLVDQFAIDTAHHTIQLLASQIKSSVSSDQQISLRALSAKEPLGLFTVIAYVINGTDTVAQGQVRYRIDRFADVLVAVDRIATRQIVANDDFIVQRTNVTTLIEKPVTDVSSIAGLRMKRNLAKGTILTVSALETAPEVESGRDVSIVYQSGLCRITASGTALQSGRLGDHIKIRNKTSGQVVLATVTNTSEVSVTP